MYRASSTVSLRDYLPSFLLPLLLCYLVTSHPVSAQQIIQGSWSWPDQGVSTVDPNGDNGEFANVHKFAVFEGRLIVGGAFLYAGGQEIRALAAWDGDEWSALGTGVGPDGGVPAILSLSPLLHIGGWFGTVDGVTTGGAAVWDGVEWHALGSGPSGIVWDLEWWDDGTGPALYAGGTLGNYRVAKWNGVVWSPLGSGTSGGVHALAGFNDGAGPALYAGGNFDSPGTNIAKWNGSEWSALGAGINDPSGHVDALATFDDGSGPALYVGGYFNQVDGQPINNLARWDGQSWSAVGAIETPQVLILKVLDDGSGPALFAAGPEFIQKWDGRSWTSYLPQPGAVGALEIFDGPEGPMLHAGGSIHFVVEPPNLLYTNIARFTPDAGGPGCGDFNRDGVTDQQDLGILLSSYDCTGPDCQGDADGDGDTDQADLGILLKFYGQKCG